ncbi:MAG: PHP domain-containing protein [Halanaerobium sp.]
MKNGKERYKIELHAHSAESSRCGSIGAAETVKKYYESGYQVLVLTDHYYARFFDKISNLSWKKQLQKYLRGYYTASKAAQKLEFKVFLGIEIKFNNDPNEYLIYGLNEEFLLKHPRLHQLSLEEFKNLISDHKEGILIFQAHPFRPGMAPEAVELLDGLEVYNGNRRHDSKNARAFSYAAEHNLKMVSGSDFHEDEDLARGGIAADQLPAKISELCFLLKSGDYKLIKNGEF